MQIGQGADQVSPSTQAADGNRAPNLKDLQSTCISWTLADMPTSNAGCNMTIEFALTKHTKHPQSPKLDPEWCKF